MKIKVTEREEKDYWKEYRDNSKSFDEHMEIVCEGFYTLTKTEGGYNYKVVNEYFD